MVPDRGQQRDTCHLKGLQHSSLEPPPHRIELLATEPSHLARDHVASTHHQIGLKGDQSLHPLMNGRDVADGAIAAVEVTDQPDPQRRPVGSPYR